MNQAQDDNQNLESSPWEQSHFQGLYRETTKQQLIALIGETEFKALHERSNWRGFYAVISTWLVMFAALFAVAFAVTKPWYLMLPIIIISLMIIAGRQLGLAILMHEASHRTLFKSNKLNDTLASWFAGAPILLDLKQYRKHHAQHHIHTGTVADVDMRLTLGFPTTKSSMARKFLRDFSGLTSAKALIGLLMMNAGILKWTVAGDVEFLPKDQKLSCRQRIWSHLKQGIINTLPTLFFHLGLFAVLYLLGFAWVYAVWWAAYFFFYAAFIRIRSIAEHAMTSQNENMLENTRSTKAGFIARALVAPFHVNFHIEHHSHIFVPYWQLPSLHKLMRENKLVKQPPTYWQVLKMAMSRPA